MESRAHRQLKAWALSALRASGCCAVAEEVACPLHRSRADVAGYLDALPASTRRRLAVAPTPILRLPQGALPRSVIIEVKVSHADLRSDARHPAVLRSRQALLARRLLEVREQFVRPLEPHLRVAGATLFDATDPWRFERSGLHAHRLLSRAIHQNHAALAAQTKLAMMAHYRLANWLFVLAPGPDWDLPPITAVDTPPGWGLLHADTTGNLSVVAPAPLLEAPQQRVQRLLRNIAASLSRRATPPSSGTA